MTTRLSLAALPALTGVSVPRYQRSDLTAGILHFGVGNFHRAHQAVYLDSLFNLGEGHDWALVGAGVRAADEAMRQKLSAQDWLTTVVEQEADASAAHVTGARSSPDRENAMSCRAIARRRTTSRIASASVRSVLRNFSRAGVA